jgi:hypothetical protein
MAGRDARPTEKSGPIQPDLAGAIREWATERRLDRAHLERWRALDEPSARALLDVARGLRMRVGQFDEALGMLEEIALVEHETVAGVLARPALKRILEGSDSAPARARALVEGLRAIRFPRLRRAIERIKTGIAALRLPRTVAVVLPKSLGTDELRIEIRARSGPELGEAIAALERSSGALQRIAEMIGGEGFAPDEL